MGFCKCKRRTDLFCFECKKSVCEKCILEEHQTCLVKKYVDWLTDAEADPATCGVCKGELHSENVIRLMCFDLFHPECLDVYASSLPPHTAKAGYLCPSCAKPIFPADTDNPMAVKIKEYLSQAAWAKPLQQVWKPEPETPPTHLGPTAPVESGGGFDDSIGIASRKPQRDYSIMINDEDEEDKYKKRSVMQLFNALGLVQQSKPKSGRKIRVNKQRLLFLIVLAICLTIVVYIGTSLTANLDLEDDTPA